jgi:hypothetical protein
MGNAAGQLAHGLHLLCLPELLFEETPFRHVMSENDISRVSVKNQGMARQFDIQGRSVLPPVSKSRALSRILR